MRWPLGGAFKDKFQGQTVTTSLQTGERARPEQKQGDSALAMQGSLCVGGPPGRADLPGKEPWDVSVLDSEPRDLLRAEAT